MTQTVFAPAPAEGLEQQDPAPDGRSRRTVLVAGGLVAALALGGGGYLLLGGGSSSGNAPVALPRPLPPAAKLVGSKPAAPAKTAAKAPAKIPAVSTAPIGRDPFKALYVQPAAAAGGTAGSTATTSSSSSTAPASGSSASAPAGGSSSGVPAPTASYALTLVNVTGGTNGSAPLFTWSVGGTTKTVLAAQKFGKYGELVTLTYVKNSAGRPVGAILQVGDDEPVGVRVGEKITVK